MPSVLIVENEPDITEAFACFLTLRGYSVRTAADGPEALRQMATERPHAVLLDIYLPTMNGLEVLRHVHATAPDLGVILVSACIDQATRDLALALGARACLQKPVSLHDLQTFVAYTVAQRASAAAPQWN